MASLPTEQIALLKMFVQACEANPSILHSPELGFYRDYLTSLGAKLPPVKAWEPPKSEEKPKNEEPSASAEPTPKTPEEPPTKPAAEPLSDESDEVESDLELNLDFVTGPESEELPTLPTTDKEVSEEDSDKADDKRREAMRFMSDGELETALATFTEAIELNPLMAVLYAKRAQLFVRMNRPNAAIQDCNRALELNANSALAFKQRGRANRLLGNIDEAYKDLGRGQGVDYDDDTDELMKSLKDDAHKVQEHKNKQSHREKEKEIKRRKKEAARRRAHAQQVYEERQQWEKEQREQNAAGGMPGGFPGGMGGMPGGFPGGMGGMPGGFPGGMGGMPGGFPGASEAGGMPAGLNDILQDPELLECFKDPEVGSAFAEISQNPSASDKYKNNPKVMKVINKLQKKFADGGVDPPRPPPSGAASSGSAPSGPADSSNDLD